MKCERNRARSHSVWQKHKWHTDLLVLLLYFHFFLISVSPSGIQIQGVVNTEIMQSINQLFLNNFENKIIQNAQYILKAVQTNI